MNKRCRHSRRNWSNGLFNNSDQQFSKVAIDVKYLLPSSLTIQISHCRCRYSDIDGPTTHKWKYRGLLVLNLIRLHFLLRPRTGPAQHNRLRPRGSGRYTLVRVFPFCFFHLYSSMHLVHHSISILFYKIMCRFLLSFDWSENNGHVYNNVGLNIHKFQERGHFVLLLHLWFDVSWNYSNWAFFYIHYLDFELDSFTQP